ncbi:MAG TPA: hypothetical protein VFH70_00580, partial [Acidimicrobiales bacterium]|nr:hypothetical protein [Acidimicrobiales bacterium]
LRWRSGTGYLLSAVVAQVLFAVHSGGDWMMGGRFLLPCLVGIYILPVIGLVAVGERLERWVPHRGLAAVAAVAVTWTALYPYIGVQPRDPVTRLTAGLGDSALIGSGGYDWSPLWEAMPTLLSCAGAGDLVAVTEAGVGPFVRPDLRVLDLRGLTDSRIAHAAPDSMKSYAGVRDVDWWQPTSPVGRVILADQPELIVTIDTGPAVALGGEYTGVVAYHVRDQAVFVYARSGTTCTVPPLPFPPEGFS